MVADKLIGLLKEERRLLEAKTVDLEKVGQLLIEIEDLFNRLALKQGDLPPVDAGPGQYDPGLTARLATIALLRRENMELLQSTAANLGRQITSLKRGRAALQAYTDPL
ncbi:MAG: hypothetical protein GX973_02485 [Firmicutes bacterium]|nr:hypothetical protein [Bacillota bacterium]